MRLSAPELFTALREPAEGVLEPVFSTLAEPRFALGLETIYEGYLVHYGRARAYEPADGDAALVLGDYLYAQGLARIAALGDVDSVSDLAELISLCAHVQAERGAGDGAAWAATAALLGQGALAEARSALIERGDAAPLDRLARGSAGDEGVDRTLAAHAALVG